MGAGFQMLTNIAVSSYSIAMLAFLFLSVLLLISWKAKLHGKPLILACLLTAAWAGELAWQSAWGGASTRITDVMEVLRNIGWTFFLLLLLGFFQSAKNSFDFKINSSVTAIGAFYSVVLSAAFVRGENGSPFAAIGFIARPISHVACAVLGLLLVEQLYRNTRVEQRWGIKFACLGIGGLFVYDFYMYSDALLFRHVNAEIWTARGVVNALTVPLIALSVSRNPTWPLGIIATYLSSFGSGVRRGDLFISDGIGWVLSAFFWR
jgi:hypothetical protein